MIDIKKDVPITFLGEAALAAERKKQTRIGLLVVALGIALLPILYISGRADTLSLRQKSLLLHILAAIGLGFMNGFVSLVVPVLGLAVILYYVFTLR